VKSDSRFGSAYREVKCEDTEDGVGQ